MYRLDGTVSSIIPGKAEHYIAKVDFKQEPKPQEYLFHKLSFNRMSIGDAEKDKNQKDKRQSVEEAGKAAGLPPKLKSRKKSHQPYSTKGAGAQKNGRTSRAVSGRNSSQDSDGSKEGYNSKMNKTGLSSIEDKDKISRNHEEAFKKKVTRLFKGVGIPKPTSSES